MLLIPPSSFMSALRQENRDIYAEGDKMNQEPAFTNNVLDVLRDLQDLAGHLTSPNIHLSPVQRFSLFTSILTLTGTVLQSCGQEAPNYVRVYQVRTVDRSGCAFDPGKKEDRILLGAYVMGRLDTPTACPPNETGKHSCEVVTACHVEADPVDTNTH